MPERASIGPEPVIPRLCNPGDKFSHRYPEKTVVEVYVQRASGLMNDCLPRFRLLAIFPQQFLPIAAARVRHRTRNVVWAYVQPRKHILLLPAKACTAVSPEIRRDLDTASISQFRPFRLSGCSMNGRAQRLVFGCSWQCAATISACAIVQEIDLLLRYSTCPYGVLPLMTVPCRAQHRSWPLFYLYNIEGE